MSINVNAVKILQFKAYADNVKHGGNNNGYVDGDEEKVFRKKCKTAGIDNIDEIMENYTENRVKKEAEFDLNKTMPNASVETAVIAALSDDTILRTNSKSIKTAQTIKAGIKEADGAKNWWNPLSWFNNEAEILGSTAFINSSNVLDVITDDEVIEKIGTADEDDDIRQTAINQLLSSVLQAAEERKIDVSNIIIDYNGTYITGRDIEGIQIGTKISDEETLTAVINEVRKQINSDKETVNGSNNEKTEMLTIAARRIDARGNGNGYIDTADETKEFKQFAASHGYDIDTILEQIRDNEENGVENTTLAQQTIYNIFDPEQKADYESKVNGLALNISKSFKDGLENDDEELLTEAARAISSNEIMQVLHDNPKLVDELVNNYDYNWVRNLFGKDDDYQNYTTPILKALCDYAIENGIEIDDIVLINEDKYIVGGKVLGAKTGTDATDSDNVAKVVSALHIRIKSQM